MPNRLSKLLSSSSKEKEALAEAARNQPTNESSRPPPPSYQQEPPEYDHEDATAPPDLTAGFSNLSLSEKQPDDLPSKEACIAHLKLLECFYRLRQQVGSFDGLYGIHDTLVTEQSQGSDDKTAQLLSKLAEKRWAVFVQRAVQRFEKWWVAVTPGASMRSNSRLQNEGNLGRLCAPVKDVIHFTEENLPPVDVLMVWHAYMLNPRAYLEDCLRYGRMRLWHTQMPWKPVSDSINSQTFAYEVSEQAKAAYTSLTGSVWDNLEDQDSKSVTCPQCYRTNKGAWTTCFTAAPTSSTASGDLTALVDGMLSSGEGFCDRNFMATCYQCHTKISHETLELGKFRNDVKLLLSDDVPLAGTLLGSKGIPWMAFDEREVLMLYANGTPNDLLRGGLGRLILAGKQANGDIELGGADNMEYVRKMLEAALADKDYVRRARSTTTGRPSRSERIAIRRMMSRYWGNSSIFALDLVGAVVRQGSFIEKMHGIDWLHSPALPSTMQRLVGKYVRFMKIMAEHPLDMAVPTLDVDLAWHTHQLAPYGYMAYTVKRARQFIDHDDKVAETKLNDAFAWTSKTYQKEFGEPYSTCTCWYCEAVRESHTSTASRLFNTSSARVSEQPQLHGATQDPSKSVHISAHNAVRPSDTAGRYDPLATQKADALEKYYKKACDRARKKGRPAPRRDDYYYSDAWGYPVYIPAYSPYIGFVPYAPLYYPVTPGCMALGAGAAGNCCAGTCGGGVAAGGCSTAACGGGGCAGGAAGGCAGAGGGGACGGGGGGGCGGGGGGGGCGGGGGGCGGGG